MGFDPFKWRKRGIARLKDELEQQMPGYMAGDERVVASMLGQTHPSAVGTVAGDVYFKASFRYLYLAVTPRHLYVFVLDQFKPKNIKELLGKIPLGTVDIQVSGPSLKIDDTRITYSTGEKEAANRVAVAAQRTASAAD